MDITISFLNEAAKAPLCKMDPSTGRRYPAVIRLDCRMKHLYTLIKDGNQNFKDEAVTHGRVNEWVLGTPELTAISINEILSNLATYAIRILEGYSEFTYDTATYGSYTALAATALEESSDYVDNFSEPDKYNIDAVYDDMADFLSSRYVKPYLDELKQEQDDDKLEARFKHIMMIVEADTMNEAMSVRFDFTAKQLAKAIKAIF